MTNIRRDRGSRAAAATLAAVAILALTAGCGGSSGGSGAAAGASSSMPMPSSSGATAGDSSQPVSGTTITMRNFAFFPASLSVAPGTEITVRNDDKAPHTVTADDKSFDTGEVDPGKSATFTAPSKPGTYDYICTIHPYMKGKLVVG